MPVAEVVIAKPSPRTTPPFDLTGPPPAGFATWCDWAKAGLGNALDGMNKAGSGVTEYHVGSRGLHRSGPADQIKNVDYWNQMCLLCCGQVFLPTSLTGRDTACRIIPRDV
jgi:hypothetical protein